MTYESMTLDDLEASQCTMVTKNWPYLENGEKYSLGYYLPLIGSSICPFRWNENNQPWM